MTDKKKPRPRKRDEKPIRDFAPLLKRLTVEMRSAYRGAGIELDSTDERTNLKAAVDGILPTYLRREVAEFCELMECETPMVVPEESDADIDDEDFD